MNNDRALAKATTTPENNLVAEMMPFAFPAARKGEPDEIKEAPFVYVPNLILKVADRLSEHLRYANKSINTLKITAC